MQQDRAAKRVVVVGAGPAGMMAAATAASRGHCVTLLEKNPMAGKKLLMCEHNAAFCLPSFALLIAYVDMIPQFLQNGDMEIRVLRKSQGV